MLFVTGLCHTHCGYCTLSERRWQKDVVYANERPITKDEELLEEARLMDALGTGITGGDPLLRLDRTLHYAALLKNEFSDHHIHLYTASPLDERILQKMEGFIDELRFHLTDFSNISAVKKALEYDFDVGVEIPMFPSRIKETRNLIKSLKEVGIHFINLNELEYTDKNVGYLKKAGYILDSGSCRVQGSEEAALESIEGEEILHYCSSHDKDATQLRNRLIRRARNVRKPYEEVEDGLLVKGVITLKSNEEAHSVKSFLLSNVDIPESFIEVVGVHVYTHWALAEEAAPWVKARWDDPQIGIEKRYPTYDQPLLEYIPL